jgi:hypothetical protein
MEAVMTLSELEQVRALLSRGFANGKYYDRATGCYCIGGAAISVRSGDPIPQDAFVQDMRKSKSILDEISDDLGFFNRDEMMRAFDAAPARVVKLLDVVIRNRQ